MTIFRASKSVDCLFCTIVTWNLAVGGFRGSEIVKRLVGDRQDPPEDKLYVIQKDRWKDFAVLRLWNDRSGASEQMSVNWAKVKVVLTYPLILSLEQLQHVLPLDLGQEPDGMGPDQALQAGHGQTGGSCSCRRGGGRNSCGSCWGGRRGHLGRWGFAVTIPFLFLF